MKIPWQLVISAFCGGICLSLSELMGMLSHKEAVDIYFFAGMLVAGLIGIGGFFAVGASGVRSAFAAGVSAPQIIGGLAKAVPAGAKALSTMLIVSQPLYAQTVAHHDSLKVDSARVIVVLDGLDSLQVRAGNTIHVVGNGTVLKLPKNDTVTVSGEDIQSQKTVVGTAKNQVLRIGTEQPKANFFRGVFAQKTAAKHVISVNVESSTNKGD